MEFQQRQLYNYFQLGFDQVQQKESNFESPDFVSFNVRESTPESAARFLPTDTPNKKNEKSNPIKNVDKIRILILSKFV